MAPSRLRLGRKMGKRLLPGSEICSRSPPMADHRCRQKLQEVIRRHQECKVAFQDLRSQIKSGLLEASDVFISLSVPLMKLVGLKAEEMAEDGKSSTIIVNPEPQTVAAYAVRAKEACEEISDKQKLNGQRLVRLLCGIGVHLNTRQESIHRALDSTRGSFCHFIKRAASFLSSLPRAGQQTQLTQAGQDATVRLAAKVLHAAYEHVSSALEDVEEDADSLLRSLAEATCGPMVAHIRELRADAEGGAPARLSALVGEMEAVLAELRAETAVARKKARMAEEERAEAVRVCREMRAALEGAAMAGSRKGKQSRSSISTSPWAEGRGTNGLGGVHLRKRPTASPYSSIERDAERTSRRTVVTRSRGVRPYSTCK